MKGAIYWQSYGIPKDEIPNRSQDAGDYETYKLMQKANLAQELRKLADLVEKGDIHIIVGEESCNHMFDDEDM